MQSIQTIVQTRGCDSVHDMATGDHIEIEPQSDAMMPLTIEKIGSDRLAVSHHYIQRGDVMYDPEIVFRLSGDNWVPIRYTQHPHIHQYNEDGLTQVTEFIEDWDQTLRSQGYMTAATNGGDA